MAKQPKCGGTHTKYDGSYWTYDRRGIPLARVCGDCESQKLAKYRPEVLRDPDYWADEPVEEGR